VDGIALKHLLLQEQVRTNPLAMLKNGKTLSPLLQAAEAFDEELRQFEAAAESVKKAPMSSGKHLERMAQTLKEVAAIDERLGVQVRALVTVINEVRDRQQAQAEAVLKQAQELQRRSAEFQTLQEKYAGLGKVAAELNESLQTALQTTGGKPVPELSSTLAQALDRLTQAASDAEALEHEAQEKDFSDLVRHADSLRQQVLSTKNRLQLLAEKLREATH
jgi:chromosome segregation ATPase